MKIVVQREMETVPNSAPCISIAGRFDAFEVDAFQQQVDDLLAAGATSLHVDLSEVTFVDSSGLAQLVRTQKRCRELDGELTLLSPSDPVIVILELTRLDMAFIIDGDPRNN